MYEIFEKLLKMHNVTAYKVGKATGIASSTFTDWKNGRSIPKQEKLQKIADYFEISIEELMGKEKKEEGNETDREHKERLEILKVNKDLRILFDAEKGMSSKDLQLILEMVERMKGGND